MLLELKEQFQKYNNELHIKLGRKEVIEQKLLSVQDRVKEINSEMDILSKASVFLQMLSDTTRQQVIDRIGSIVTDALQKVKDPDLEFKMLLTTERNQVDLKFTVVDKSTKQEYDILNSCGGSIADIVTFPLRIALIVKWDPALARILILDENFKFVSVQDQEPLAEFVQQIAEKLNMQILLVTHSPQVASKAHKIFEVSRKNSVSIVEEKPSYIGVQDVK